jgi:hypothetical protein
MKKILLSIVAALGLAAAGAEGANLQRGNVEVEGLFNFNHSSRVTRYTDSTRRTSFYAGAKVQYFFHDLFSAGLTGSFATSGVRPLYNSVGLSMTKYFSLRQSWAPYVGATPIMWVNATGTPSDYASSVRVGAKYFLTDSVAFGPALDYTRFWGRGALPSVNRVSFLGAFAVHF